MEHVEERASLGRPLWEEIRQTIPRVQHSGKLEMPSRGASVSLKALRREHPRLPYIKPAAPSTRAAKLLSQSADGAWTPSLREQVRACFEADAAGIEIALCMPEVVAPEELMADERYQVKENGRVVGCKLFCPGCRTNAFVVTKGINLNSSTGVRFAYGNGKSIMPVSREYGCCNPACPEVAKKHAPSSVEMQLLKQFTADGILGASAMR